MPFFLRSLRTQRGSFSKKPDAAKERELPHGAIILKAIRYAVRFLIVERCVSLTQAACASEGMGQIVLCRHLLRAAGLSA